MRTAILLLLALGIGSIVVAQQKPPEEPDYSKQLQRIAPLKADEALASFEIAGPFQLQLVASEPLIASPVAMAFDEDGRLFVVEMRDYSEHPTAKLGRVRLLEDDDGDGVMDRSTVFADGLSWPTAIACANGGVYVGAAPDIIFLKDTDGDGRADEKKVIFNGFSRGNVQGMLNTFLYGLDHRIHVAASSGGGSVKRADLADAKPIDIRGRDFAFDPITLAAAPVSGGAQHGAAFDDYGRRFLCHNSDHLQMVMYEDRYAVNSKATPPPSKQSIAADGPQAEVFRISPVEPWRELRTKLRVAGAVPGPVEGGGRAAGYFTSATGITVYRGDAWPAEHRGTVFVADVGSNIIHRKKLTPRGIGFTGTRIDEGREFIASRDTWFRPVQMANAPDGCLWVIDMYRETIEHPASIPPAIKKHVDLDSGRDRGRIWRVAPIGGIAAELRKSPEFRHLALFKPRPTPKLSAFKTDQLVALLEHPNAWHRETAARLIHERKDEKAAEPLRKLLRETKSPLGRLHALYALDGLGKLAADDLLLAMNDESPELREHAIRLMDTAGIKSAALTERAVQLSQDESPRVRLQFALSLPGVNADQVLPGLALILAKAGDDPVTRWAVARVTTGSEVEMLGLLIMLRNDRDQIESMARGLDERSIPAAIDLLKSLKPTGEGYETALVIGLSRNLVQRGRDAGEAIDRGAPEHGRLLRRWWETSRAHLDDAGRKEADRVLAVKMLALDTPQRSGPILAKAIAPAQSIEIQKAAAFWLAAYPSADVIPLLIEAATTASPPVRVQIIDGLLSRRERMAALLDALESARLTFTSLTAEQRSRLLNSPDDRQRARAAKLIAGAADKQKVIDELITSIGVQTGDVARGKKVFAEHCAACHKLEGVGHELAPNLAAFAQRGGDAIITNVIDPNREVNPQYLNYVVTLKDGEIVSGLIKGETASSVTVASGKGVERTIARGDIESLRATGKSMMPEGLEAALLPRPAADLIAYLMSLKEAK